MPQPFLDYDTTPWCSKKNIDVESYNNVCMEMASQYKKCGECPFMELQAYTITTKDKRFKEFI